LPKQKLYTAALAQHPCDTTHCSADVLPFLNSYFAAKTAHDFPAMNAHFDPERTVYGDAVGGWVFRSNAELVSNWKDAVSLWPANAGFYPTRIIGNSSGVMIDVTDTPEMLGVEVRGIAAVSLENGLITRWVDYWDSRPLLTIGRTERSVAPTDFGDGAGTSYNDSPSIRVCDTLHAALTSGDVEAAGSLFSIDAALEDMTLRIIIRGRAAIVRFLSRASRDLPYGSGSTKLHSLGGHQGGGYEWRAINPKIDRGVSTCQLDAAGAISYLGTIWDSSLLPGTDLTKLVAHAFDR
jgi:hypothetical protein